MWRSRRDAGHMSNNCPHNADRPAEAFRPRAYVGIPSSFLRKVEDPNAVGAMVNAEGATVVMAPNECVIRVSVGALDSCTLLVLSVALLPTSARCAHACIPVALDPWCRRGTRPHFYVERSSITLGAYVLNMCRTVHAVGRTRRIGANGSGSAALPCPRRCSRWRARTCLRTCSAPSATSSFAAPRSCHAAAPAFATRAFATSSTRPTLCARHAASRRRPRRLCQTRRCARSAASFHYRPG